MKHGKTGGIPGITIPTRHGGKGLIHICFLIEREPE